MDKENKVIKNINADGICDSSKIKNKDIFIKPSKWQIVTMILMFFIYGGLTYFLKGSIVVAMQGAAFSVLLTYMSFVDLKLKLVSDYFVLGIIGTALITLIPNLIAGYYVHCIYSVFAAIMIPIPLFIAALVSSGGIGGGDVKLTSAIALLLGFNRGLFALIFGLILAVVVQLIIVKIKKIDKKTVSFALVPYLAISAMIFYLI